MEYTYEKWKFQYFDYDNHVWHMQLHCIKQTEFVIRCTISYDKIIELFSSKKIEITYDFECNHVGWYYPIDGAAQIELK